MKKNRIKYSFIPISITVIILIIKWKEILEYIKDYIGSFPKAYLLILCSLTNNCSSQNQKNTYYDNENNNCQSSMRSVEVRNDIYYKDQNGGAPYTISKTVSFTMNNTPASITPNWFEHYWRVTIYTKPVRRYYGSGQIAVDDSLVMTRFPGGYLTGDGKARYYFTDYQGNNLATVDAEGKIVESTGYYPYGKMSQLHFFGEKHCFFR